MRYYCTYFDSNYLLQGLALYESLCKHSRDPFKLWILCFDIKSEEILSDLNLSQVELISCRCFEKFYPELQTAKNNRNLVEYYWTCTPALPLYVFATNPDVNVIAYLDADLYFFSDPAPIFTEFGSNSVAIIGHRFPPELIDLEVYGLYNVSLLIFRNDEYGKAVLESWRKQCIDWCYSFLDGDKFGDQKYLDSWPAKYAGVIVLQQPGVGLAPWNLSNVRFGEKPALHLEQGSLVVYHFHRFKLISIQAFTHGIEIYTVFFKSNYLKYEYLELIYFPYAVHLQHLLLDIQAVESDYRPLSFQQNRGYFLIGFLNGQVLFIPGSLFSIWNRFIIWRAEAEWLIRKAYSPGTKRIQALVDMANALLRRPELLIKAFDGFKSIRSLPKLK